MDFDDTPEEARFRAEAREWLAQAVAEHRREFPASEVEEEQLAAAKAWQCKKFDAGYAAITWPPALGGRNGGEMDVVIFRQEEARHGLPTWELGIGLGMCIPIVNIFGSDAHRARHLRRALRGEEVWSQLFSEPGAGSDLAGVRTRAERDGSHWVVNGQKIWTSGAHFSQFGIVLVRTNRSAPKHKGLTMFIVDVQAPGVTVRPVKQLNGKAEFNEVFFDNVRIPDADRLGNVDEGWQVAVRTLMLERHVAGGGLGFIDYEEILQLARKVSFNDKPAIQDGRIRERIADMYLNTRAGKLLSYKSLTAVSKGQTPGPEQSIIKVVAAAQGQQASNLAMDLMDRTGLLTHDAFGDDWSKIEYTWSWGAAMRIAGGSDEVLKNIIAERILGLPADSRPDKDTPFCDLP